ncbi:hypothetical protein CXB51_035840 [Gossypium anomalum]|uniref:Uncharacterized protein n=1 Tax=Gossypium anomalum TaxID=47600 RepID=A0A8J6CIC9_9ROSI|nr:hypothetical protein CXB51_035840 [Gossypium anomalum]
MKAGLLGMLHSPPCATSVPLRHVRARVTCSSSSGHISFIKDVAATQPPENLQHLLKMLQTRGETIVSPGSRHGLIPLAIPLSENMSGSMTALLRWPTAPPGMEMPVVEVRKHGVWLLANNVDQYIHRILVEEDADESHGSNGELFHASSEAGKKLYTRGDFAESKISNLDGYLLKKVHENVYEIVESENDSVLKFSVQSKIVDGGKSLFCHQVGLFPDLLERKVMRHFEEGDQVSALVTGEFYTKKDLFPGFGRPFVFNAEVLLKARIRGKRFCKGGFEITMDVASIAQWEDEQIEYIKEKVSEEGRQEDLKKGKALAQVALDEAAFLLDLASIDGTWGDYLDRIAECYKEAGLGEIANFILYRD